jgi:hypothetical protein
MKLVPLAGVDLVSDLATLGKPKPGGEKPATHAGAATTGSDCSRAFRGLRSAAGDSFDLRRLPPKH